MNRYYVLVLSSLGADVGHDLRLRIYGGRVLFNPFGSYLFVQ